MIKTHTIDVILSSNSDLYHKIEKKALNKGIDFNELLELLVSNGLYRHLLSTVTIARFPESKKIIDKKIVFYENRFEGLEFHTIEVKLSTDIEAYQINIYKTIEKLALEHATSFETMLAVLIQDGLERHLKYNLKWFC